MTANKSKFSSESVIKIQNAFALEITDKNVILFTLLIMNVFHKPINL